MGRTYIEGFMERGMANIDQLLEIHLKHNHYPPIHSIFIPVAKKAIEYGNFEEWDEEIELPNGKVLTAYQIIEALHLDSFLDMED